VTDTKDDEVRDERDENGLFAPNNTLWRLRKTNGRKKKLTPDDLFRKAQEYFQYCEDNPLQEELVKTVNHKLERVLTNKTRAFTKAGFYVFAGMCEKTFSKYKKLDPDESPENADYVRVVEWIELVIYEQKFTAAAVGLLDKTMISRDLGLAEKTESTVDFTEAPDFNDFYDEG